MSAKMLKAPVKPAEPKMVTLSISAQGRKTYGDNNAKDNTAYKGEISYSYQYNDKEESNIARLVADGSADNADYYRYEISVPEDLEKITLTASGTTYEFEGRDVKTEFLLWGVPEKAGSSLQHEKLSDNALYTVNLQELKNSAGDYIFRLEVVFAPQTEKADKALYAYGHVFNVDGQSKFFDKDGQSVEGIIEVETDEKEVTLFALDVMPKEYQDYELSYIAVDKVDEGTGDRVTIEKLENGQKEVTITPALDPDNAVTVTFMYVKKASAGSHSVGVRISNDGKNTTDPGMVDYSWTLGDGSGSGTLDLAEHNSVKYFDENVPAGAKVTLTPEAHWKKWTTGNRTFEGLAVNIFGGKEGLTRFNKNDFTVSKGTATFNMPDEDVLVEVEFNEMGTKDITVTLDSQHSYDLANEDKNIYPGTVSYSYVYCGHEYTGSKNLNDNDKQFVIKVPEGYNAGLVKTYVVDEITLSAAGSTDPYTEFVLWGRDVSDGLFKEKQDENLHKSATDTFQIELLDNRDFEVVFKPSTAPVQQPTLNIFTYFDNVLDGTTGKVDYAVNQPIDLTTIYKESATNNGHNYKLDFGGYTIGGEAIAIDVNEARNSLKTSPNDSLTLEAGKDYQIHVYYQQVGYNVNVKKDAQNGGEVTTPAGEAVVDALMYKGGEQVVLTAAEKEGYYFDGWEVEGAVVDKDALAKRTLSFTMPEQPVNVTAVFEKIYHVEYYEYDTDTQTAGVQIGNDGIFCTTKGVGEMAIKADLGDAGELANDVDKYKNYSIMIVDEAGKLVKGSQYLVAVADDTEGNRTIAYGKEKDQTLFKFILVPPTEPLVQAELQVQYLADGQETVLIDPEVISVQFNKDNLNNDGTINYGYLSAKNEGEDIVRLIYSVVEGKDGKQYALKEIPTNDTIIAWEDQLGTLKLYYTERHDPINVTVQYQNESGAELQAAVQTLAQFNVNNVDLSERQIAYGELKDVEGQTSLSSLILAQLVKDGATYELTNAPAAGTLLAAALDNDQYAVTITLVYKVKETTGPVNPGGDVTPGGDDNNPGGGDGGSNTPGDGGNTDIVIPNNNTPLAPSAPTTPDNTVVVPAEVVIDESEVPLGEGPQGSSENPKTGAEQAKDLSALALLLAAGALGIEFKRKRA